MGEKGADTYHETENNQSASEIKKQQEDVEKQSTQALNELKQQLPTPEQMAANKVLLETLAKKIAEEAKFQDKDEPKLKELIAQGEWREAFKMGFSILWSSIFGDKKGEIGFPLFDDVDRWIEDLGIKHKTAAELQQLEKEIDDMLSSSLSLKAKLAYTKVLSVIKERQDALKAPTASAEQALYERLDSEIQVGTVILMNKQEAGTGGRLLQNLFEHDLDMTHVIVVTDKGPPPLFSHATGEKFRNVQESGVETEVDLFAYIKNTPADYVFLQPGKLNTTEITERVQRLKGAAYSYTDAAVAATGYEQGSDGDQKYNCGAYVAEVLGFEEGGAQSLALPSNRLSDKRLKPSYLFTWRGVVGKV